MARTYPIQANFTRGEASPKLHARVDIEFYKAMLKTCTNWTVMRAGGLRRRPSFLFVAETKDSTKASRLIPFNFGTPSNGIPQAYVLEFGDLYMRILTTGGIITTLGGTPTAATSANPGVFTLAGHGLVNGDKALATGFAGDFAQLNNREFTVAGVAGNNFNLGVNTTGFAAYVAAAGLIKKIVEVVTTYAEADLPKLDYAQSADKLTITHLSYQSKDFTRTSDTQWTATNVTFKDGPYLDEPVDNTVLVTLSITNGITPKMTSNVLPSGTVTASDGGADAFEVFDQDLTTNDSVGAVGATWTYDLPGAATAVCNNYWIVSDPNNTSNAPGSWTFQGFDGTNWIDLDRRSGETAWGGGEVRFYDFVNAIAFQQYRLVSSGTVSGATTVNIAEMGWGYNGDFAPTATATFSGLANINDGAGFDANDIGRNIRFRATDGKWRYMIITGVTSNLIVTGRIYGYALPNLSALSRWKLGSFRGGSWPSKVGYYQSRRAFARSILQPYTVWLSQTFGFTSFGVNSPVLDDDALSVTMLTGTVNGVMWLDDAESLAVGTTDNVRLIGKANQNLGFGASNFDHQTKSFVGTKEIKPVKVQNVLVYADKLGKTLREFVYNFDTDGYVAPDITVLSDHLFKAGVVQMAYQETPDSVIWCCMADGSLVAVTYERDQKIVGITNCPVAGGDPGTTALVESVCCIPGATRTEVYIIVKRTIGGVTKRIIERMAPEFEYGLLVDAAVGVDSALQYSGAATGTVYGFWHLRGLAVNVLGDGAVYRNITVSNIGTITLPLSATAAKWTGGLPYRSFGETLELASITPDGVHLGRRKLTGELMVSTMNSLGLTLKGMTAIDAVNLWDRDNTIDPASGAMVLRTGIYPTRFDQSWRDGGQFQFYVDDPLPCIIRAFIFGVDGEP